VSYESRGREEKRRVGQAFLEYFVICGWTQMDLGLGLRSEFWGDDQIVWHKIRESCVYRSSSRARKVWSGNRCTVWREVLSLHFIYRWIWKAYQVFYTQNATKLRDCPEAFYCFIVSLSIIIS